MCVCVCVFAANVQCVCVCLHRRLEWKHLTAVINDNNTITIKNVLNNASELLGMNINAPHNTIRSMLTIIEFNDKVVRASLDWSHLVVTTTTSGFIYRYYTALLIIALIEFYCYCRENSWTSPVVFDLRTKNVNLLKQAEKYVNIRCDKV